MTAIDRLQHFINERWAACQATFYPEVAEPPRVPAEVTEWEAEYFLDTVESAEPEPPLFQIDDSRQMRSDRRPPKKGGQPALFNFFEDPGTCRLETIAHMAAMARFRDKFGWPREHLIFESAPLFDDQGDELLTVSALDVLLLDEPCRQPSATMNPTTMSCRVGVEVKQTSRYLDSLIRGMRGCKGSPDRGHSRSEHKKCQALDLLHPRFFLGIAAGEDWRLFKVQECDGRAVLGEQLPDLDLLYFDSVL